MAQAPKPEATSRWTEIRLENKSRSKEKLLIIGKIHLDWGKIYPEGDVDADDVPIEKIQGTEIKPEKPFIFRACGRANSSSGTSGNFNLNYLGEPELNISWDSPWGIGTVNLLEVKSLRDEPRWGWTIINKGAAGKTHGPLGNVTIEFRPYA